MRARVTYEVLELGELGIEHDGGVDLSVSIESELLGEPDAEPFKRSEG
jgi:hypothetical protein